MQRITHHHRPDLYDLFGNPAAADVAYYTALALQADGEILEIGVGTGRTVLPAVRQGATVTGLDVDEAMLARLREKLADEPADVQDRLTVLHGDARQLALEGFALVTLPFQALNYVTDPADRGLVLESCFRALRPGGTIALNMFRQHEARFNSLAGPMAGVWRLVDQRPDPHSGLNVMLSVAGRANPKTRVLHNRLRFEWVDSEGNLVRTVLQDSELACIGPDEIRTALAAVGFVEVHIDGGFQGEPFTEASGIQVVRAKRP